MTARDLMNLMMGYPDYKITGFIWDYDFEDNCTHDLSHPELLHFYPVDGYADDRTKTIVLNLRQRI